MAKILMDPQATSTVTMKISSINILDEMWSPEVFVHGIPFKVQVRKNAEEHSLAVALQCAKKDDSSDWTVAASAAITLMPYNNKKSTRVHHITPFVFSSSSYSFGTDEFILWDELFNKDNKYVRDDTIKLNIEITAEDPNSLTKSTLKLKNIIKNDCGSNHSTAIFRLTVGNVENLMAVRSPPFILRCLPWDLMVYKDQASKFGVTLDSIESPNNVPCKMTMSVKLLSSKQGVSVEKSDTGDDIQWPDNLDIKDIISWDKLMKPKNGYVNNDSITLEVKIKAKKADGDLDANNAVHRGHFECSICLEEWGDQDMSITACGHPFCTACITKVIEDRGTCPLCNEPVRLNDLCRLFLFAAK